LTFIFVVYFKVEFGGHFNFKRILIRLKKINIFKLFISLNISLDLIRRIKVTLIEGEYNNLLVSIRLK